MEVKIKDIIILVLFITITSYISINLKNKIKAQEISKSTSIMSNYDPKVDAIVNITKEVEEVTPSNVNTSDNDIIVIKSGCVGVLDIPSIGVRSQIKVGTDDETLKNYVGMTKNSGKFGEVGNVSLAAHNNIHTEIFRNLHKLQIGSNIRIITKDKEYIYRMVSQTVVSPYDTSVLNSSGKKEVTLITCNYNASKRIIVKCEFVSQKSI